MGKKTEKKVLRTLSIMGRAGHATFQWDPETGEGFAEAKAAFDGAKRDGMMMFEKTDQGANERVAELNRYGRDAVGVAALAGG